MRFASFSSLNNEVVVDESELAYDRMDIAYTLAYAFLDAVQVQPTWNDYG